MGDLICISGVTKHYGDDFALRDVNLSVPRGCVTGFVGANGAGKTTTIKAILGLVSIESGSIELFGEPFGMNADGERSRRAKERIGVVFDTCPYVGELSVKMAGRIMAASYSSWDARRFADYLRRFSLDPKKKVKDLSRGMGMKLQLACALSHDADLLILDEATAGLDPLARDELLDELRDYASTGDRGVLLSSHITSDLERIADRVVGIDAGSIIFDMPREQITDVAGIAHCTAEQAQRILACVDGARAAKREFSCDVLVPNRFEFAEAFPEVPCDRTSIDDYLHFILKGNN